MAHHMGATGPAAGMAGRGALHRESLAEWDRGQIARSGYAFNLHDQE